MDGHVFRYRCPECHHIVEMGQLFDRGCPLCGWTSPLKTKKFAEEIPPSLKAMADMLPSGTDLNALGWRELGEKKRKCPTCGNEREEKELMEKGCLICGWHPRPKIGEKLVEREITVDMLDKREALVDVFDKPDYIKVVMEAPNVSEGDIRVEVNPESQKLTISAPSKGYRRELALPSPTAGEPVISFRHGTLEVKVKKHAD